jgi:hypothetical protein
MRLKTLHKTYCRYGFFSVTVDYGQQIRLEEEPIPILLSASQQIGGRIDQHANQNATARMHGCENILPMTVDRHAYLI